MILDNGIASSQDVNNAWTRVSSGKWKESMKKKLLPGGRKANEQNLDEIRNLLMVFGGFTPPPTPTVGSHDKQWSGSAAPEMKSNQQNKKLKLPNTSQQASSNAVDGSGNRSGRARGRGRK